MGMFLILLHYKKPLEEVDRVLPAHSVFLEECYRKNQLICSGPQVPRRGGLMLSQMTSREEVDALTRRDPFFEAGIADYQVIEFDPRMKHPMFQF